MKKIFLITICCIIFLALIATVVYLNPRTTPVSIQLNTVKIDRNCNELDNVPIELTGKWIYPLFQDARLDITSSDFDDMTQLETVGHNSDHFPGAVPEQLPSLDFLKCSGGMFHRAKNNYEFCNILFSPDQQRWMLAFRGNDVFYVGSTNSADTLEDLYEYFKPQIIGTWPGDPNDNDKYQYFGRWVSADGKDVETVDLVLKAEEKKSEDSRDVLDLYFDLPNDFPYTFTKDEIYYNGSNGVVPYFISTGYTLGKEANEPKLVHFAYDKEKNWSIFVWEDTPEQYLIVSGKPQYDTAEILEHFKAFLDLLPYGE